MRRILLALGIACAIGLYHAWLVHTAESALGDDARVATEVRCQGLREGADRECRRLHEKLYLARALDPERALRAHCTRGAPVELGVRPLAPPALCVERYGGWLHG